MKKRIMFCLLFSVLFIASCESKSKDGSGNSASRSVTVNQQNPAQPAQKEELTLKVGDSLEILGAVFNSDKEAYTITFRKNGSEKEVVKDVEICHYPSGDLDGWKRLTEEQGVILGKVDHPTEGGVLRVYICCTSKNDVFIAFTIGTPSSTPILTSKEALAFSKDDTSIASQWKYILCYRTNNLETKITIEKGMNHYKFVAK